MQLWKKTPYVSAKFYCKTTFHSLQWQKTKIKREKKRTLCFTQIGDPPLELADPEMSVGSSWETQQ